MSLTKSERTIIMSMWSKISTQAIPLALRPRSGECQTGWDGAKVGNNVGLLRTGDNEERIVRRG